MSLSDYLPGKKQILSAGIPEDERDRLVKMRQLEYKEGNNEPPKGINTKIIKPETMSDDDWQTALSIFPPERVVELYNTFEPSSSVPFYEKLYQSIYKKPVAPDEKKMQAARSMAGIGDALSLIVQSIAAGKGSFIEKRDSANDAITKTDAVNERLREIYRRERDNYNAGFWGSQLKDTETARGQYQRDRAALLALLAKQKDNSYRNQRFWGEMLYKLNKAEVDETDKKKKLKLQQDTNQIRRDYLTWQREKNKLPRKETPKGYLDFFDPSTAMTYRVAEKKWKANFSQIYNRVKSELFKKYPLLESQEKLGNLKPSEKEEYVKQYMYDNSNALKFLENIAETSFKDGEPEPELKLPVLTDVQYNSIEALAKKYHKDETKVLSEIASYLKSQGFNQKDIKTLLRAMQE